MSAAKSASFARAAHPLKLRRQAALSEKPQTADQRLLDIIEMEKEVVEEIKRQVGIFDVGAQPAAKPLPQGSEGKNLPKIMAPPKYGLRVNIVKLLELAHAPLGWSALQQINNNQNDAVPVNTPSHKADRWSNRSATTLWIAATKTETNKGLVRKISRTASRFSLVVSAMQRAAAIRASFFLMRLG
jgi:hypothetical protein